MVVIQVLVAANLTPLLPRLSSDFSYYHFSLSPTFSAFEVSCNEIGLTR